LTHKETLTLLSSYGWSETLQRDFTLLAAQGLVPARVTIQRRGAWRLITETGEMEGRVSGRFGHEAAEGLWPVTGDWLAVELKSKVAVIQHILPRRTAFTRLAAGGSGAAQVVAANVDVALIAASLNADLNPRRLERYLAAAHESGAKPVILLTKADACEGVAALMAEITAIAAGAPVIAVSARTGEGLDALAALMPAGQTAVLLGSSGVGKSTLVNALAGEALMATQSIREGDARGRHTTTHRELILLPSGALILDTPGMRELGLWDAQAGVDAAFADVAAEVERIALGCKFTDCAHGQEPGCAVRAALADGTLDPERWESFRKLAGELAHERRKEDPRARAQARKDWIAKTRGVRSMLQQRRREREE
jgi:ribosome biogenesis GTPase